MTSQPKLYTELASWWPLLSDPAEYEEEATFFARTLIQASPSRPRTVLELGSGGGNTASHLKNQFQMTLVERSPEMLAVSRSLNPECEHFEGDMRRIRLGRIFDAVFIHDAIDYMTTEDDLRRALETAAVHCRPNGAALFVPDSICESFKPQTQHGGQDGEQRALRYLEWTYDPDSSDSTYLTDYAYMQRDSTGAVRVETDHHVLGLFAGAVWLRLLSQVGFEPKVLTDNYDRQVFVATEAA